MGKPATYKDAAAIILGRSQMPMHYADITDRAIEEGMIAPSEKTPHATMGSQLATDIRKGPRSRFVRASPSHYALNPDYEHPTVANKILSEYKYFIHTVELTDKEYERYVKYTQIIVMLSTCTDAESKLELERAIMLRARIIRDAVNKIPKFKEIINSIPDLKHTLIYCSENQSNEILTILLQANYAVRTITASEPKHPEERIEIIQDLKNEICNAIVAIGILDEGVDVPEVKRCILLSSSGNPKQFIQRRGRVLQKFFGSYADGSKKEFAIIHDILCVPKSVSYVKEGLAVAR